MILIVPCASAGAAESTRARARSDERMRVSGSRAGPPLGGAPAARQARRTRCRPCVGHGEGIPPGGGSQRSSRIAPMLNVLVTMRFDRTQLDRLRAVSPEVSVSQADADTADYSKVDVLYAGAPPRDLARAPALRWVQLHMAGVNALADHPLYTQTALPPATPRAEPPGHTR